MQRASFLFDAGRVLARMVGGLLDGTAPPVPEDEAARALAAAPPGLLVWAHQEGPEGAGAAVGRLFAAYVPARAAAGGAGPAVRVAFPPSAAAAAHAALDTPPEGHDQREWAGFRQRVRAVAAGHDELECVARLANETGLADAGRWWRRTLERLHRAGPSYRELAGVLAVAAREVSAATRTAPRTAGAEAASVRPRLWRRADAPPGAVERGAVVVARPAVGPAELAAGYFAPRPAVLGRVEAAFAAWRRERVRRLQQGVLPVFWIGGEHGRGKSVLLLQLLARLHAAGDRPVIWLGGRVEELPDALNWLAGFEERVPVAGEPRWAPGVVGLDDPYARQPGSGAEEVWAGAVARCADAAGAAGPADGAGPPGGSAYRFPLLVCCGPPGQLARFRDDHRDRVAVTQVTVPPCDPDEIEELRRWYTGRTGRRPAATAGDGALPLHLLLDWQEQDEQRRPGPPDRRDQGDRREGPRPGPGAHPGPDPGSDGSGGRGTGGFAATYRERVRAADEACGPPGALRLADVVARVAALSRFEIGYPAAAVASLLDRERRERLPELYVTRTADTWRMHPRLAATVFPGAFPAGASVAERARVLGDTVADLRRWGTSPAERNAPLWALAGAARRDGPDRDVLPRLLPAAYERLRAYGRPARADLPVWVELAAACPEIELDPHPAGLAIASLSTEPAEPAEAGESGESAAGPGAPGLRLTCHKLLQHQGRLPAHRDAIRRAVGDLLARTGGGDWPGWEPVALDALRTLPDPRIRELVRRHVAGRPPARTGTLALALWAATPDADRAGLARTLTRALPAAPAAHAWARVVEGLVKRARHGDETALRTAYEWVAARSGTPAAGRPLGALLRLAEGWPLELNVPAAPGPAWLAAERPRLWRLARRWAATWHASEWGNYVLEPLVWHEAPGVGAEVWEWCARWIDADCGDPTVLLEAIIEHGAGPDVRDRAWDWLRSGSHERASWGRVWTALRRAGGDPAALAELAWTCLRETVDGGGGHWGHVWGDLWDELWQRPGEHAAELAELEDLAARWLDGHGHMDQWTHVWDQLSRRRPAHVTRALRYLAATPTGRRSWPPVWDRAWFMSAETERPDEVRAALLDLGRRWLDDHAGDDAGPAWKGMRIWLECAQDAPRDWPHFGTGLAWLDGGVDSAASFVPIERVWLRLWRRHRDDPRLRAAGLRLLADPGLRRGAWLRVLRALAPYAGADRLVPAALTWIRADRQPSELVPSLVEEVKDHPGAPEALLAETVGWLQAAPAGSDTWRKVWRIAASWPLDGVPDGDAREAALRAVALRPFAHRDLAADGMISFWLRAWEYGADREALAAHLRAVADRALPFNPGSVRAWRTACEHHERLRGDRPGPRELERIGRRWLAQAGRAGAEWAQVWLHLWYRHPGDPELTARLAGLAGAAGEAEHTAPGGLPGAVPALPDDDARTAIDRLLRAEQDPDGAAGPPPVRAILRDALLAGDPEEAGTRWALAWTAVWRPGDEELRARAERWLPGASGLGRAVPVWLRLWRDRPAAALARLGLDRLRTAPTDDAAWLTVWRELAAWDRPVPGLAEVVGGRLSGDPPVAGGGVAEWQAALLADPGDAELARYVTLWLTQHADHSGWSDLWPRVWEARPGDAGLAAAALRWLRLHETSSAWPRIAARLWTDTGDPRAGRLIRAHLLAWPRYVDRQDLPVLWTAALHPGFAAGLRSGGVAGRDPGPDLVAPAAAWLARRTGGRRAWARVWCACWDAADRHDQDVRAGLAPLGVDWLRKVGPYRGWRADRWTGIWTRLWDAGRDRPALRRLEAGQSHGIRNGPGWREISRRLPGDEKDTGAR